MKSVVYMNVRDDAKPYKQIMNMMEECLKEGGFAEMSHRVEMIQKEHRWSKGEPKTVNVFDLKLVWESENESVGN